jgi:hypothetical protein
MTVYHGFIAAISYSLWANLGLLVAEGFIVWNWKDVVMLRRSTTSARQAFWAGIVLAIMCIGVMIYGALLH